MNAALKVQKEGILMKSVETETQILGTRSETAAFTVRPLVGLLFCKNSVTA